MMSPITASMPEAMELRATRGVSRPSHTSPSMESHWKDLERRQGMVIFIWNIPGKGGYHPLTLCILTSHKGWLPTNERFLMISLSKMFPLKSIIFFSGKRSAAQVWLPEATWRYVKAVVTGDKIPCIPLVLVLVWFPLGLLTSLSNRNITCQCMKFQYCIMFGDWLKSTFVACLVSISHIVLPHLLPMHLHMTNI